MKVRSSVFDLEISGKLGNVVAGTARGGIRWLRGRVIPTNPQTTRQGVVRNAMSDSANEWATDLTQAERDDWDAYAALVLKQGKSLTGEQWYVGANALRKGAGLAQVSAGPTVLSRDNFTAPTDIALSSLTLDFTITNTDGWANEVGGALLVFATAPPGIIPSRAFNNQGYPYLGKILGAASPPANPQSLDAASLYTAGNRAFLKFVSVRADGRYSPPFFTSVIAT